MGKVSSLNHLRGIFMKLVQTAAPTLPCEKDTEQNIVLEKRIDRFFTLFLPV